MKLDIPKKPVDGHQIYYWTIDGRSEGLIQHRMTYVKGPKSVYEVTGNDFYKGHGIPFENEWNTHGRYVPGDEGDASPWGPGGRNHHAELIDERHPASDIEGGFPTFEAAKEALLGRLKKKTDWHHSEERRLIVLSVGIAALEEPPP